ncbi:MAG: hypothetical protein F4X59_03115 [Holophagales bacterium]|nr:hypothetical protein [Holophagales bacterium]MYC09101.1 hypothetical protein [Holophagales bacterium]
MLNLTIRGLASTLVAGAVLLPSKPLSAQTEVEIISASEYGTTLRFRDDDGVLVERFTGARRTVEDFFDEYGNVERVVTRYPDGRSVTERLAYGQPSPDGGERFPVARGRNMSREEMDGLLSLLPPLPETSRKTELGLYRGRPRSVDGAASDPGHPWGYHWKEHGDGFARTTFRLLHQEIEVESVRLGDKRLDEEWLRVTDSRGGLRHDRLTKSARLEQDCGGGPWNCDTVVLPAVASYDSVGRIAQVVTNDEGYPAETWYGETLVARYHYPHVDGVRPLPPHGGLGDFWVELIDVRTGRRLLDSRALPTTSARPLFSAGGTTIKSGVVESVDDALFAVVNNGPFLARYALLPLGEGPVWRTVQAAGTEAPELRSLVHYTDDRLRIEFQFDHTDLVVEAPRRGASPIKVMWPKDITLPFRVGEDVVALNAPPQPLPPPPEEGLIPSPGP